MLLPTVVAAEFAIIQAITDLPLRNFRVLPFNLPDAQKCAELNSHHYRQVLGNVGQRDSVKDDFKIIAQTVVQQAQFLITEDDETLCRYCERLKVDQKVAFTVINLNSEVEKGRFVRTHLAIRVYDKQSYS